MVVNCFQNRIFALSFTTTFNSSSDKAALWIAFRIVSLHYRSQQLLVTLLHLVVVNCFQNRIFALSFTTRVIHSCYHNKLWIAFRIVSLHYRSQHFGFSKVQKEGCELLSESYLCIIVHNLIWTLELWEPVVNCFQNRIFALSFTTFWLFSNSEKGLWIAFRIVSLHYRSQR